MPGTIILLNGASSSGKSTLAQALQTQLHAPFWHYSIDHLLSANILPRTRIDSGGFPWFPHAPNSSSKGSTTAFLRLPRQETN